MYHISDTIDGLLKQLAAKLPQVTQHSHEKHLITGKEILEWNTITEIDGKPIIPEKTYLWKYPVIIAANHHRRLRNRYKQSQIPGVQAYLEWIASKAKGHKVQQQMKAIMTVIKTIAENK